MARGLGDVNVYHIGAECDDCGIRPQVETMYLFADWTSVKSLGYPIFYWRCKNQLMCVERRKEAGDGV